MGIYDVLKQIVINTTAKEDNKITFFYFDNKTIQAVTGLSERAVSRSLQKLTEQGLITKMVYRPAIGRGIFTKYRIVDQDILELLNWIEKEE